MSSWIIGALLLLAGAALYAEPVIEIRTDRDAVSYRVGEPIHFRVTLEEAGKPVPGYTIEWDRNGDDGVRQQGKGASDAPITVTTRLLRPGFVRLTCHVTPEGNKRRLTHLWRAGSAAAEPEKMEIAPEPKDFDSFWARQKARLAAEPLRELERKPLPPETPGVVCYDVKVSSAGGMPVSGYLAMPEKAAAKSLPATVVFFGYGVYDVKRRDHEAAKGIVLRVNAHGILNGQPQRYYMDLAQGALANYACSYAENQKAETSYFNGMMLRAMRALEYVRSLPEWDGKNLTVTGHSQGGMQAIVAAGLDQRVTKCEAYQPWMCDVWGAELGHLRGHWYVRPTKALLYYDPIYHVRRFGGELEVNAGLGDYVCPPSGVSMVYRNASGRKRITYTQGADHTAEATGESIRQASPGKSAE